MLFQKWMDKRIEEYQSDLLQKYCDVSFRYPRTENWALRHVSLKFGIGDKVAVVGENVATGCTYDSAKVRDCIAVFDHGQIVQHGPHKELVLDERGKYHELWHAQAQYYTHSTS